MIMTTLGKSDLQINPAVSTEELIVESGEITHADRTVEALSRLLQTEKPEV